MHLITVTEPITHGSTKLAVGSYLSDNVNAGEIMARHPRTIHIQQAPNPAPIGEMFKDSAITESTASHRILVIRAGGFGDLLFLTPVFRHIKEHCPNAHIAVSCFDNFAPVFENNPDVAEIIDYPPTLAAVESFDAIVPLENTVEVEQERHAVDRYFIEFGIDPQSIPAVAKKCRYYPTEKERSGALSTFPAHINEAGGSVARLGVQAAASALCRTYPHDQLAQVCQALHSRGWEIFFFGDPRSLQIQEAERITNLTLRALTFRQSAAVLETCDVILAPDSALTHLAGALDLPCVALYGPFPWKLRTAYHPKTMAIQGKGACSPCFHHVHGRRHWPENGPCARSGRCEVLASIEPARVCAKISALYKASVHLAEHRNTGKLAP